MTRHACFLMISILVAPLFLHDIAYAAEIKIFRNAALGFEISYNTQNWEDLHGPESPPFFIKRKSSSEPATLTINIANAGGEGKNLIENVASDPQVFVERYRRRFPDATMIDNGPTYLGGFPAHFISAKYTLRNLNASTEFVVLQIFCAKDDKIYLVNLETLSTGFDEVFGEFQKILATFNFR